MKRKILTPSLVLFLASLTVASAGTIFGQPKTAAKPFTNNGFYNGIEMTSKESGDYGGISVYLTESDGRNYALVTLAEGVSYVPVLVPARITGPEMRTVEFSYRSPTYRRELKLKGTITADGISLTGYGEPRMLKRKCATTYSNITANKTSGDYEGMEVYLTDSDGKWYVLVTVAEGVLKVPMLLPAEVSGSNFDKITFTLPTGSGSRKFIGTISTRPAAMTLKEAGTTSILKSKCYM